MTEAQVAELMAWIAGEGLAGRSETDVIGGFCERLGAHGVPLTRVIAFIDTLHPVYEGRAFRWERGIAGVTGTDYGRSTEGEAAERWRASPFYHLLQSGESALRRRVSAESEAEFIGLRGLREASITDYVAIVDRIAADGVVGGMDCFYSSWMTDRESGFLDDEVALLRRLTPFVGLAVKAASLGRMAQTLVETYLGRDPGRRVLDGRIARGVADRLKTVLWFSDLQNFTRIADTAPPEQIIPLLNDYADVVVSAIHENEGDVLKLIGDGVLAIFPAAERAAACAAALKAARSAWNAVEALNARRGALGLPITDMYLGLHIGEVFYGNIGSEARLDFTVIGPAVNEVSRIAAMCRSIDQPVLLSQAFASAAADPRPFVSVGRYALRGVARPQELFTLDRTP
ncbi:MAG TPA: adenylate/guanylate cyclase domain-containing protein [Roseiarcus sp.]|jgi:adenylate cyclase